MLTLNEMIEYENENTNLDFKREEYAKEKYNDLIKDVMSMANSPTNQPKAIGRELSEHVNQSEEVLTDRDHVKNASDNYPNHTYEELYDIYSRYYEDIFHGDKGDYYISPSSMFDVYDEVIESNLVRGVVTGSVEQLLDHDSGKILKITGDYGTDGHPAEISMWLEIEEGSSEATLVRLTVDDEEAVIK